MAYFEHLNYTLGDEDARIEQALVPEGASDVVAIAGAGNRLIPILARAPARLRLFDIQPAQLALTELRLVGLRALEREELIGFLGFDDSMAPAQRQRVFASLPLSDDARRHLGPVLEASGWGPLVYLGRFEQMLAQLARVAGVYAGARARGILDMQTLDDQRAYYAASFPRRRWKHVVFLMGNSSVLNALLYRGEFPRKNRPESAYAIYRGIFERLFTTMLARESFFLQLVLLGRVPLREGWPVECDAATYDRAREAVGRTWVELVQADVVETLAAERGRVAYVAMSDVPSFLPPARERSFLQTIRPALAQEALVVTRGHLRVAAPDESGYDRVTASHAALLASERTQLWKIDVYQHTGTS